MALMVNPVNGITRRGFLKSTGVLAGAAICAAGTGIAVAETSGSDEKSGGSEQTYNVICRINCNTGNCNMTAHVRDGKLVKTTAIENPPEGYDRRPCLRGRTHLQWIYNDARVKYPMRRAKGTERGDGQWERITWDEAIEEISSSFLSIMGKYGPQAIVFPSLTGGMGGCPDAINTTAAMFRNMFGMTNLDYCLDFGTLVGIGRVTKNQPSTIFGYTIDAGSGNPNWDMLNAKTIVLWGANPTESWIHQWHWFMDAVENGSKMVVIDPRFSTAASKADAFYPVRVATDTALALGMIKEIIDNESYDKEFMLERTVAAFLVRQDTKQFLCESDLDGVERAEGGDRYLVWNPETGSPEPVEQVASPALTGSFEVNGIKVDVVLDLVRDAVAEFTLEKTEEVTGLSRAQILELVDIYTNQGPVFTCSLYGVDRFCDGDVTAHAMAILASLTGNIGVPGGAFGQTWGSYGGMVNGYGYVFPEGAVGQQEIPMMLVPDIVKTGYFGEGEKRREFPIKAMMVLHGNPLANNAGQTEYIEELLPALDLVVTVDSILTDTARYSDYVLPAAHWFEKEGIIAPTGGVAQFCGFSEKAIEPLYEAKTNMDIFRMLGKKMGKPDIYPEGAEEAIMRQFMDTPENLAMGYSYDRLREEKLIYVTPYYECEQPGGKKTWPTNTGRLEIYQPNPLPRMDWGQEFDADFYRLPRVRPQSEVSRDSEAAAKYPIVNMNEHVRWRVHTTFGRNKWLRELDPEPVIYVSRQDALEREIESGDYVKAFNDHGMIVLKAIIDDSLPAGLSNIPKGWERDQTVEGGYQSLSFRYVNPVTVNQQFAEQRIEIVKVEVTDRD